MKAIYVMRSYKELFFCNLIMGEKNELKNKNMLIQAPDELLERNKADDNRTSTEQVTEQVKILISIIITIAKFAIVHKEEYFIGQNVKFINT